MKPKTMILLVVAVGCGLVASYMTSRVIADRSAPQEVTKVPVVYAIKNIQQGLLIKNPEEWFQVRMMPDDVAPRGKVIRELSELKDKRLINPVGADKHVSLDDLLSSTEMGLTYRIPPGMRAVSVKVSQDTSVSGFVLPGMFVDIMCVPNGKNECNTILQRVQVLAVNMLDVRDPDKRAMETNLVTFAASPKDSQILALASHSGHLRLSLRHVDDDKIAAAPGATAQDLVRLSQDTNDATTQPDAGPPTAPTAPTPVPTLPPTPPSPPEPTTSTPEPVKQPEPPPQPKVVWVMTIRDGSRVQQHKFYDEPAIDVEKSEPDADLPKPKELPKKASGPEGNSPEPSSPDAAPSPKAPEVKK